MRFLFDFFRPYLSRTTGIAEPSAAGGAGERPIKCQGWKGVKNRSKFYSLGGRVSTLALILEGEM